MQKKIIALAVAGLVSGVAFAQTNVTVYGVIDQNYTYSKSDTGLTGAKSGDYKFSGLRDGTSTGLQGSRFGFKGEEALGNGLKAIFTMEYGKEQDQVDAGTFNIRQSFVGLSSNYGTITAGRHYNAASDIYGQNSVNGVTGVNPVNVLQGQGASQIRSQGGNARQDNLIKYVSPTFSGFTGRASYAFGENSQTMSPAATYDKRAETTDNGRFTISGDYTNGPLNVDVAYGLVNNYRTTAIATTDRQGNNVNEWYIGGGYDFKVVKINATYQQLKNDNDDTFAMTDSKLWSLGLSAPVGANGKVMLEYAKVDFDQDNNTNAATRQDGGSKGWGLGYQHNLSKRTTLYTFVSQFDHDNTTWTGGTFGSGAPASAVAGTSAAGEKQSNFVMGVRHQF